MVAFSVDAKDAGKGEREKWDASQIWFDFCPENSDFWIWAVNRSPCAILRRENVEVYVIRILIWFFLVVFGIRLKTKISSAFWAPSTSTGIIMTSIEESLHHLSLQGKCFLLYRRMWVQGILSFRTSWWTVVNFPFAEKHSKWFFFFSSSFV